MKKKFTRQTVTLILTLLALVLLPVLFTACDNGECKHSRTKDTSHEPDCSHQGYVLHECRDCGYTYKSDFVEPYGHTITVKTTDPTCTEQGSTTYTCAMCDYSYTTDYIAPLGHNLKTTVTSPTCTESGYTTYTCTRDCSFSYQSDLVAPRGHNLASAHYAATCTTGGYTRYMCTDCDLDYRSATSKPLGHTFIDTVVRPSFAKTGYTKHTCYCGYSYVDSYVWYSDIFTGAKGDGTKVLSTGVDLSYHNKEIDWDALKATGIDFVILRAAYGVDLPDSKFEEYYKDARKAGLDIGCYFYTYATDVETVLEEVDYLLTLLDGKQFEYPVYFDLEDPSQERIDTETLMEMSLAFCQAMTDNGYFPAVYTNNRWLVNFWNKEQLTTLYDIWYARYPLDNNGVSHFEYGTWTVVPDYAGEYGMWQYTEYGRIDGIEGDADLNMCYKDYPTLIKKYGYNGFTAE